MNTTKKKYFASDFHLGFPDADSSRIREKRLVAWLDSIKDDAEELYLLGDLFDFWYEYTWMVPRGFVRFIGKLAELSDLGIKIYLFNGNHDMWYFNYFQQEVGLTLTPQPFITEWNGKKFFFHHGHALGRHDYGMKLLTWLYTNKFLQFCLSRIHPNLVFWFAHRWSSHSRQSKEYEAENFMGEDKERLLQYSKELLASTHYDYFIYGHRHLSLDMIIGTNSHYINLGNWLTKATYGVWDGVAFTLHEFEQTAK